MRFDDIIKVLRRFGVEVDEKYVQKVYDEIKRSKMNEYGKVLYVVRKILDENEKYLPAKMVCTAIGDIMGYNVKYLLRQEKMLKKEGLIKWYTIDDYLKNESESVKETVKKLMGYTSIVSLALAAAKYLEGGITQREASEIYGVSECSLRNLIKRARMVKKRGD